MKQENQNSVFLKPKETLHRFRVCVSFVVLLLLFLYSRTTQAQQPLRIDFEARNISLPALLNKLYDEQKINLAFSSDDMDTNKKLSYKARAKTIEGILNDILIPNGYNFKKIGGQYVIFKDEKPQITHDQPLAPPPIVIDTTDREIINQAQKTDSLIFLPTFVTDTIVRFDVRTDTIIRIDTIHIRDTVFREIKVRDHKSKRRYSIDANQRAEDGFSIQIAYSQIYTDYLVKAKSGGNTISQLYKKALIPSWQNQSVAVNGMYSKDRLTYSLQIGLTSLRHNFKYSNTVVNGDYYRTDTLDMYYSIVGVDTVWVAVTDSTYIPRVEHKIDYRSFNKLLMLNSHLDARYNLIHNPDFKLYAGAGFGFYYVLDHDITVVEFEGENDQIPMKDAEVQTFCFSYNLKFGAQMAISRHVDINAELNYKQSINSLLKDYPVNVRFLCVGLQLGFIYHFH